MVKLTKNVSQPKKFGKTQDIDDNDVDNSDQDDEEVSNEDENEDEDDGEEEDDDDNETDDDVEADDDKDDDDDDDDDDSFEVQSDEGSSDDSIVDEESDSEAEGENGNERSLIVNKAESSVRQYRQDNIVKNATKSSKLSRPKVSSNSTSLTELLNTDDLSSDEEDNDGNNNTVGRIPLHWYDAYDHIGYTIQGEKLIKRSAMPNGGKDRIDRAIENRDNINNGANVVYDMYNDREVVLSARDIEIIQRIQAGTFAHPEHDDTPDYVDYYSSIKEIMPISKRPLPKSKFLPSKWELLKVKKILKNMRNGTYKTIEQRELEKRNKDAKPYVYNIWVDEDNNEINPENRISNQRAMYHLPAPKMPLPGHAESYNPPGEYLLTEREREEMLSLDPEDRQYNFLPQQFSSLRHVSGYSNFVLERFERCLDLYLCPRKLKLRLNIDPETLIPRHVSSG